MPAHVRFAVLFEASTAFPPTRPRRAATMSWASPCRCWVPCCVLASKVNPGKGHVGRVDIIWGGLENPAAAGTSICTWQFKHNCLQLSSRDFESVDSLLSFGQGWSEAKRIQRSVCAFSKKLKSGRHTVSNPCARG